MFYFRLLEGRHNQGGVTYKKGDKFYSNYDLRKLNGPGASKKFELISKPKASQPVAAPLSQAQAIRPKLVQPQVVEPVEEVEPEEEMEPVEEAEEAAPESEEEDDLESLTVEELKDLAEAEEIDLNGARLKADIIAAIRVARAE